MVRIPDEKPHGGDEGSRVRRWLPTVSMMLVSLISYIDRNTLALLAPTILEETQLTVEQYGFIISAFSLAYMAGNPVWGAVLDRVGLRKGMTAAVSFWTFASAGHALAHGFAGFAVARGLLGFGEGATFPGGLRTAVHTLPPGSRSRGIAVAYSGGSLGAIVTPIIITPIALAYGWRGAFIFTGLIGMGWVLVWTFTSRRMPRASVAAAPKAVRLSLRDAKLWAFMAAYALGALPLAFVIYGAAIYLNEARGLSQASIGRLLWIPPLGWEVGYFFWGWVTDRFRRTGSIPFAGLMAGAAIASLPLGIAPFLPSVGTVMFLLFFAMFVASGFVILSIAYATEVFSPDHSGLIAGVGAGSWSAAVALVMPVFGRALELERYDIAFPLACVFPPAGFFLWRALASAKFRTLELAGK
ncbi:MAG: MFS transporter [Bryobacteraceae bacterium]